MSSETIPASETIPGSVKTVMIGDVSVSRAEEWNGPLGAPSDVLADVDNEALKEEASWLSPNYWDLSTNSLLLGFHPYIIKSAGKTILLDTGAGNGKDRPNLPDFSGMQTPFLTTLANSGVKPDDVDLVICTHLHVDHVGWNTELRGDEWVPTFRNARYLIPELDWTYWHPDNDSQYTRVGDWFNINVFDDSVRPVETAGQAEFVRADGAYRIDENLTLEPAPGHTPGHMVLKVDSAGDRALFSGDTVHSPAQLAFPNWNSAFCEEADVARATRMSLLSWVADTGALLLPAHFAGPHAVRLAREDKRFRVTEFVNLDSPSA